MKAGAYAIIAAGVLVFACKEIISRQITDHPGWREVIHVFLGLLTGAVVLPTLFKAFASGPVNGEEGAPAEK